MLNVIQLNAMKRISNPTWAEIRVAYASGIGLREIARNMGIPAGTILSRAKREGWRVQLQAARAIVPRQPDSPVTCAADAAAVTMQQRGLRHVSRVAGVTERMLGTFERLPEDEQLRFVDELEKLDKIGRRTFGLEDTGSGAGMVQAIEINLNVG